jgi:hypothetical protein
MHTHWCDLAANTTSTGSTRQFEDCRQDVAWSGWYLREENENTR